MKKMTISEWLSWYKQHGGTDNLELEPYELVSYQPEHGFIVYFCHDDILEIHHMVGDGKYWQGFIRNMLFGVCGAKKVRYFTRRNPEAIIRKYGGHIRGYYMECDIDEFKI